MVERSECSLCLERFGSQELAFCSSCSQAFHAACLQLATTFDSRCPLCRTDLAACGYQVNGEVRHPVNRRFDVLESTVRRSTNELRQQIDDMNRIFNDIYEFCQTEEVTRLHNARLVALVERFSNTSRCILRFMQSFASRLPQDLLEEHANLQARVQAWIDRFSEFINASCQNCSSGPSAAQAESKSRGKCKGSQSSAVRRCPNSAQAQSKTRGKGGRSQSSTIARRRPAAANDRVRHLPQVRRLRVAPHVRRRPACNHTMSIVRRRPAAALNTTIE